MDWTLERTLPVYDKRERHERWISAAPPDVWAALMNLRAYDLGLTVALTRLRGGPAAWGRHQHDDLDNRVLDSMAPRVLASRPPHEVVLGDVARYAALRPERPGIDRDDPEAFTAFDESGWSKVAMNFRLSAEKGGTRVYTETRVHSTDEETRRTFGRYWLLMSFGSSLVRHDILRALARKAG